MEFVISLFKAEEKLLFVGGGGAGLIPSDYLEESGLKFTFYWMVRLVVLCTMHYANLIIDDSWELYCYLFVHNNPDGLKDY